MESSAATNEVDTAIYRLVQEALNNVAKHARARRVGGLLHYHSGQVSVVVEDDGIGFDPQKALDVRNNQLGLLGMRERATLLGGTLEVESELGRGTTVVAHLPAGARSVPT
jgi:signal transduction histidine kinase